MAFPELSTEQWHFMAALDAIGMPVAVELAEGLVRLGTGPLIDLITGGLQAGWIERDSQSRVHIGSGLPDDARQRIAAINTPEHIISLLQSFEEMTPPPDSYGEVHANLLAQTGSIHPAAQLDYSVARQALELRDRDKALLCISRCLDRLEPNPTVGDGGALFVTAALLATRLRYLMGVNLSGTLELLRKARDVAGVMGDTRSAAVCDVYMGAFYYLCDRLDKSMASLERGLKTAETLGDDDIQASTVAFKGLHYYIQGLYREAADCFEHALAVEHTRDDRVFNQYLPLFIGHSAALIGHFNRAVGVLDAYRRKAQLDGDISWSTLYQASLGMVLLRMNRRKEALVHINEAREVAIDTGNDRALYFAHRGLILYHYMEGRFSEAEEVARQASTYEQPERDYTWPLGPQYTWPVVIEVMFTADPKGYGLAIGHDPKRDQERILNGPNFNLRGTMRRILALQAGNTKQAEELLLASLRDLKRSGDPLELGKTAIELSRYRFKNNNMAAAREYALLAWSWLSSNWEESFPEDLKPMLNMPQVKTASVSDRLGSFVDLLDSYVPSAELDELLFRMVAATCRFFAAERGCLFWFRSEGAPPQIRTVYNLNASELDTAEFRGSLLQVMRAHRNGQPLATRLADGGGIRHVLCLPLGKEWVLFHENIYFDRGFDLPEREVLSRIARHAGAYIERITAYCHLIDERAQVTRQCEIMPQGEEGQFITQDRGVLELLAKLDQVAESDAGVLILGETGVGKELLARRLHAMSKRRQGPMVTVDLSCIPEQLVESELFGHEKGAFTGADRQKPGRLELADSGTFFIDEVGDIPGFMQVKLLRALQERVFVRVGGTRARSSDFRLVAATNRDLQEEVARGGFREDLYYRLNVVPLNVPPLRARGRDVIVLARYFLDFYSRKNNRSGLVLTREDEARLTGYRWPGNVRELRNVIERAVLLSRGGKLDLNLPTSVPETVSEILTLEEMERRHIRNVMAKTGGRIDGPGGAAELLGIKRTTLYGRMRKLGINPTR